MKAIKKCFKDVARKEGGDGLETMIPVFTAGDRDTWAAVRFLFLFYFFVLF